MRFAELEGSRIALWGLGREGLSTWRALRRAWPEAPLVALDDGALPVAVAADFAADGNVRVVTGPEAGAAVLPEVDAVVKSPGISLYRREVRDALARGVHVTSATRLFFAEHPGIRAVCVTGTKGKSTTASLIAHLLAVAGRRVELRGNIGRPLLDPVDVPPEVWVIELSSYQTADLEADPAVAVLTNLYPEHLDWHGDEATYFRDKLNLFVHQRDGRAVVNRADARTREHRRLFRHPIWFHDAAGFHLDAGFVCRGHDRVLPVERIRLPGAHNHGNVCAALTAVTALEPGLEPAALVEAVASFEGLAHRLMPLGEKDGVLWVDDSISTTPESAMAALAAFPARPVTVLLGGYERHLDYGELARYLVTRPVHAVVTLPASGPRIAAAIEAVRPGPGPPKLVEAADLEAAVDAARRLTPRSGVVLLSPAAPSYGAFRDFAERGEAFARAAGIRKRGQSDGERPPALP